MIWIKIQILTTESDDMAFTDPQTVTINAIANILSRVSTGQGTGAFQKDDGLVKLSIGNAYGKRVRRTLRLDHSKIAPDPLLAAQNLRYSMSTYIVADVPLQGYSIAEQKQVIDGFVAWMNASSGASITKWLGGEN